MGGPTQCAEHSARNNRRDGYSVISGTRGRRLAAAITLGATLLVGVAGCATTEDDIHRWADTLQGPRKLVAILVHSKYPMALRVEAAMTLIRMKARKGKRVGIQGDDDNMGLVGALAQLAPAERREIVTRMVPQLIAVMEQPPPKGEEGRAAPPDPSFPFKDAAFALLTHNDGALVTDAETRQKLKVALVDWTMVDFPARVDESSQIYGIEQILKYLQADGVRRLPDLIQPDAPKIDLISKLVAELGDEATKTRASEKLVVVAKDINSEQWIERKKPDVARANKASKLEPNERQFRAQLEQYQEEELLRAFSSMKLVGEQPVVTYLLAFAADSSHPAKRRAAALAALEGNLDENNKPQIDEILKLARADDTPDEVRDQALRRVGEMPRALVINDLYELFGHSNWKVRWMAAELVLKMSRTNQVAEFMDHLRGVEGMSLTEAWRYGTLIGSMKGEPKPSELVAKYSTDDNPVQARVSALGYYFENGSKEDLPKIKQYEDDKTATPKCKPDSPGCEWKCTVGEGKDAKTYDITTVGEFVKYCVEPALEKRSEAEATGQKDSDGKDEKQDENQDEKKNEKQDENQDEKK